MNDREYIIAKAKELGVTAEEMGFCKMEIPVKDEQFIHEVSQMVIGMDIKEEARENISEKYWDDLGIRPEKKYKVVNVTVKKEVYREIKVVIPEDKDESDVDEYVDNFDNLDTDYLDDEDDWEIDHVEPTYDTYTADEINYHFNTDQIYNYDDFDSDEN